MSYCQKCKEDWKHERAQAARDKAKKLANETGQTQVITKEGCIYKIFTSNGITNNAIEYVSPDLL